MTSRSRVKSQPTTFSAGKIRCAGNDVGGSGADLGLLHHINHAGGSPAAGVAFHQHSIGQGAE